MSEQSFPQVDRRAHQDTHWTVKKEIQITHVISTLALAFTAFMYVNSMEKRISMMEEKLVAQKERDASQDKLFGDAVSHMNAQVDKMDAKLDRLIERGQK